MSFVRVGFVCLSSAAAALSLTANAAEPSERPVREAFVVETDATAEKKLAAVAEYVAQGQWEAALALLREVSTARPDAMVRVSPRRSLSLDRYCDVLLARLPKAGLEVYRRGADPQAAAWLAEAEATGDERALRSVVGRAFASSSGDEAVSRLAERAWERGEFDLARRYWTSLVPPGAPRAGEALPPVLRYPDTDLDLAAVRAKLVLCSIALGQYHRAEREIEGYRSLHPDAAGRLGGREGKYSELLRDVFAAARGETPGEARDGWDVLPPAPATRTFGQTAGRSGLLTSEPPAGASLWTRPLPASTYLADGGRPALPRIPPLCYYPVVWHDKVFVADAERVYGFESATGNAAWAAGEDDPGVLYPPADDLELRTFGEERPFANNPLVGVPRHTLTVAGDRLYARIGSPVTFPSARDFRRLESSIVCLDLKREGLLAWSVSSDSLGGENDRWAFEGPPVAAGDRLYVLASRSRPQAQLNALCLDAATGAVLWNRAVGAPISSPPEGSDVMTHRLVTAAAGRLYVQTNYGAVVCLDAADGRPVWVGWYESDPPSGPAASAPERNLPAACLFSGGVLVAAPSDSDRLFAYDAESGVELWNRSLRGDGRELLGARDGILVASGERLWGLDLFTGRELWTAGYEDPAGFGSGRGLLAGRFAYYPTREDLFVMDVETGVPARRLPLKQSFGLAGGGNLAASPDRIFWTDPGSLTALGIPSRLRSRP
jgi:outer membrane protein assembly factor BamB